MTAFFHCFGSTLFLNTAVQISFKNVLRYWHHLKFDIPLNWHGDADDFIDLTMRVISWSYGDKSVYTALLI